MWMNITSRRIFQPILWYRFLPRKNGDNKHTIRKSPESAVYKFRYEHFQNWTDRTTHRILIIDQPILRPKKEIYIRTRGENILWYTQNTPWSQCSIDLMRILVLSQVLGKTRLPWSRQYIIWCMKLWDQSIVYSQLQILSTELHM